ncbi:hypothetical protein AGABI1DRAFT_111452 [Agaricus bisporus var. burnettii JB137-S8]|uniref:Uncharacterized protein n=1 Tax=Agaricus bisporus var. burnettii (strain JB137-S8 / ATCC MYA-4627 / FGSC 10392) TaxID=597362 RepID=K5W7R7_AGABU|nr:uncharacterized protein AGABI1DRAFT_111452 [Agaricus bisporus var. burnettii JB137-S8]EKM82899.1 hypothetical protein AGABI1DRAFT_111452 [Agaricus bisporus var. burnettii JB137-S8]
MPDRNFRRWRELVHFYRLGHLICAKLRQLLRHQGPTNLLEYLEAKSGQHLEIANYPLRHRRTAVGYVTYYWQIA